MNSWAGGLARGWERWLRPVRRTEPGDLLWIALHPTARSRCAWLTLAGAAPLARCLQRDAAMHNQYRIADRQVGLVARQPLLAAPDAPPPRWRRGGEGGLRQAKPAGDWSGSPA